MKGRRKPTVVGASNNHLKELPYYGYTGNLAEIHGQFNNSFSSPYKTKRDLNKLSGLYDLDLFSLNTALSDNINSDNQFPCRVNSRYYSPHTFSKLRTKISLADSTFSVFNIVSLNRNLENLQTHLLQELNFHFNIIGVSETKITNVNSQFCVAKIPGYAFEHVPTPLASGGVEMFIDESLNYHILEKTSNEAFQALWVEISFDKNKNIICGIIYRQHNSPDRFQLYFDQSIENFTSFGKRVIIMGNFNVDLLKCETSSYSHDFLSSLQSCFLIPSIDNQHVSVLPLLLL